MPPASILTAALESGTASPPCAAHGITGCLLCGELAGVAVPLPPLPSASTPDPVAVPDPPAPSPDAIDQSEVILGDPDSMPADLLDGIVADDIADEDSAAVVEEPVPAPAPSPALSRDPFWFHCLHCGHDWRPKPCNRVPGYRPRKCALCRNPRWNSAPTRQTSPRVHEARLKSRRDHAEWLRLQSLRVARVRLMTAMRALGEDESKAILHRVFPQPGARRMQTPVAQSLTIEMRDRPLSPLSPAIPPPPRME